MGGQGAGALCGDFELKGRTRTRQRWSTLRTRCISARLGALCLGLFAAVTVHQEKEQRPG